MTPWSKEQREWKVVLLIEDPFMGKGDPPPIVNLYYHEWIRSTGFMWSSHYGGGYRLCMTMVVYYLGVWCAR